MEVKISIKIEKI